MAQLFSECLLLATSVFLCKVCRPAGASDRVACCRNMSKFILVYMTLLHENTVSLTLIQFF